MSLSGIQPVNWIFCCLCGTGFCAAQVCHSAQGSGSQVAAHDSAGFSFHLGLWFNTWWVAALAALVFMALVFPILAVAEKWSKYAEMLVERKPGEIKGQFDCCMPHVCSFDFHLLGCTWPLRYLADCSCLGLGLGDAAVALVGKRFGKHIIEGPFRRAARVLREPLRCLLYRSRAVLLVLVIHGVLPWYAYVPTAGLTALVCALVELYTRNGMDTVTCPLAAISVLLPLLCLWGSVDRVKAKSGERTLLASVLLSFSRPNNFRGSFICGPIGDTARRLCQTYR